MTLPLQTILLEEIIMKIQFEDIIDFKMTKKGSLSNYKIHPWFDKCKDV